MQEQEDEGSQPLEKQKLPYYFDEWENISSSFYSPNMNVSNSNFLPLLKRLDECISYIESNPQYAESSVYLLKFRQLQSRAVGMIRTYILAVLKTAASQVHAASVSEGVEASVIYVRFKAAASELKPVLEEIETRSARKEYVQILAECHRLYCEQRLSLVKGIVHQRLSDFSKKEALPSLTRSGCAYLMQVCQMEYQLFTHFFPASSEEVSSLAPLVDPLSTYFYDILRPKLIHEANIDLLCELVHILHVEILGEQSARQSEALAVLRPTLQRILADVKERLTLRARTYIRDEIANYIPSDEDLVYPAKLEGSPNTNLGDDENADVFKTWYPPLEKTLSCLSKLYRCLEPAVFTGLAQEAVEVCSLLIQKASKIIIKRSTTMDGQLFLIKHLVILREQIAPFGIEFSVTHKELDFSHLLEHLRRILRGQASLFDWSRSTSLARTLSPRVLESQIDAKKKVSGARPMKAPLIAGARLLKLPLIAGAAMKGAMNGALIAGVFLGGVVLYGGGRTYIDRSVELHKACTEWLTNFHELCTEWFTHLFSPGVGISDLHEIGREARGVLFADFLEGFNAKISLDAYQARLALNGLSPRTAFHFHWKETAFQESFQESSSQLVVDMDMDMNNRLSLKVGASKLSWKPRWHASLSFILPTPEVPAYNPVFGISSIMGNHNWCIGGEATRTGFHLGGYLKFPDRRIISLSAHNSCDLLQASYVYSSTSQRSTLAFSASLQRAIERFHFSAGFQHAFDKCMLKARVCCGFPAECYAGVAGLVQFQLSPAFSTTIAAEVRTDTKIRAGVSLAYV